MNFEIPDLKLSPLCATCAPACSKAVFSHCWFQFVVCMCTADTCLLPACSYRLSEVWTMYSIPLIQLAQQSKYLLLFSQKQIPQCKRAGIAFCANRCATSTAHCSLSGAESPKAPALLQHSRAAVSGCRRSIFFHCRAALRCWEHQQHHFVIAAFSLGHWGPLGVECGGFKSKHC